MAPRYQLALALGLGTILLGATLARPAARMAAPPAPRGLAALVDGQPVPLALYRRELGIYRFTLPGTPPPGSPAWRAREATAEDHALRQAIAETIIAREAARRRLVATPAAIQAQLAGMRTEAGGAAALAALARAEGLSPSDLRAMARTSVLDDLLTRHSGNQHLIDQLYARAQVVYYVGPRAGLRALAAAPRAGHPAPELAATTLDGQAVTLSSLRGAPIVLNIWSTACTWCRVEMPLLDRFARAHPDLRVIALNEGDGRAAAMAYARALGLRLTIWLDPNGTAGSTYGLNGLPDTVAIDRNGIIRAVTFGALDGVSALRRDATAATG